MRTARYIFTSSCIGLAAFFFGTLIASAQTASTTVNTADGAQIKNCSQAGVTPVSVGSTVASGIYVPVADQSVITNTSQTTFNTGMLVYKECTLREIVDAQRITVTAAQIRKTTNDFMTGRNGNPLFSQDLRAERVAARDTAALLALKNGTFDALSPVFSDTVVRAVEQGYYAATRKPQDTLACPYQGDLNAALNGNIQGSVSDALWALGKMSCNPIFAAEMATERLMDSANAAADNLDTRLGWAQGVYQIETTDADGNIITQTPGSIVKTIIEQQLTSGFRQNENANNVGEMVSTLFSNISTQALSSTQGLSGLTKSSGLIGGTGSYLDQVVAQSSGQLVQSTTNAALQLLANVLAVESAYNKAVSVIATNLTQTIAQLRGVENQCWTSIIQNVCAPGSVSTSSATCTGTTGVTLTIATSTQFSKSVIDNQIMALGSSTFANLTKSNTAISQLTAIIAGVANISSPSGQAAAITKYNTLVQQGAFHTQTDVNGAQTQQQSVLTATASLVQNTINIWSGTDSSGNSTIPWNGSINPGVGWCNYQNQSTLAQWAQKWKQ